MQKQKVWSVETILYAVLPISRLLFTPLLIGGNNVNSEVASIHEILGLVSINSLKVLGLMVLQIFLRQLCQDFYDTLWPNFIVIKRRHSSSRFNITKYLGKCRILCNSR